MIGKVNLALESKKPVSQTGISWAFTTQTISNLLDSYSVPHTGSICKDSLLIFQQSFFTISATRLTWLSPCEFRKEIVAMASSYSFEINGINLSFLVDGGESSSGVVIPSLSDINSPQFMETLRLARFLYTDYHEYSEATDWNRPYIPSIRDIPTEYREYRESLIKVLFEASQEQIARRNQRNDAHRKRESLAGHVYLLKSLEDTPIYKIGRSKQYNKRIGELSAKLPFNVEILHVIPSNDHVQAEQQLHTRYADKRTNGEWFKLTDEDVQAICAITEMIFEVES